MRKILKKMSVLATLALTLFVAAGATGEAGTTLGTRVGDVLNTDIRVFIDGGQIEGFNINGNTYIAVEALEGFGFNVIWNGEARQLLVFHGSECMVITPQEIQPHIALLGSVIASIFYTDIVTYVNGIAVDSFNLGGTTVIHIDTLAEVFESPITWNSTERTLSVEILNRPQYPSHVWLSATGIRFHSIDNCGTMNPANARFVPLRYAQSTGFDSCGVCWESHN